jgi:riboflavin kinase / FMN adenylyltransferase
MTEIRGKVIHGDHYGKVLGFPTANLERRSFARRKLKIRLGVYGGKANILPPRRKRPSPPKIGGELKGWYKAAIVIGPLDEHRLPKIEAHLLNFKGSLYGKYLSIYLSTYLRPFRKYKNIGDLKKQIKNDIRRIEELNN